MQFDILLVFNQRYQLGADPALTYSGASQEVH